jgi:penicillin amidase
MTFIPSQPDTTIDPTEPRLATRRDLDDPHREHPRPALFAASLHHRAHHHLRRILIAIGTLTALVAFVLILTTAWLRHAMRASLPQLDGALHAPGLTLPVTVTRDAQGVPAIQASNLDDLLFAQGFITAQDRLWQMDALRRHASGQLAEILGASMVEHDRLQRILQISEAADRAIATLPADQLHQLQAYARGVNTSMNWSIRTGHLPVEFHLLHYTPAPWTPRDTLLVSLAMFQDLSTQFPVKLRREALATHLPAALLADLYPVGSWRDHPPTQPPPDLTTPVPEVEQIPLDHTQSQTTTPAELLNLSNQFPSLRCPECRAGSNNWAVAAAHSASGAPLVSNDMHLALNVPSIWYEATLHATASNTTPELNVTGFTLPGVPFVIVGRNQHVAWGFTNLGADVQDVRIEHLRGSGSNLEYQRADGSWQPVTHHHEHIAVRFGHDIDLDVLTTTEQLGAPTISTRAAGVPQIETPIITPLLPGEKRALSLAWTVYDPTTLVLPHLAVDTASDGAAIVAALATFGGPSLNLIYADDHNHIGYHALGAIPIRGPATQHLRTLTAPLPTGSAPIDEEDQLNDSDESDEAQSPAAQQPPPTALPSSRPIFDYTIGSPISPIPVDALDASQTWSGYIPFAQLPSIVDPPNGVLATANSRVQPDDYPYALALNWEPPYRTERIDKLLIGRTGLTPADMLALQNDVHSEFDLVVAQRLAYALDHAKLPTDTKRLHQAADILRAWNGDVTPNAVAPSIVTAARATLWPILLIPQIDAHDHRKHRSSDAAALSTLYDWDEQSVALETLLQHTPTRWLPPGFANWDDLLVSVVERGLHGAHAPSDLSTWHFGSLHLVEISHPVFATLPLFDHLLGTPTGTGPRITGGDGTTVKTIALHHGPSERFTADLSNPQITWGNITTGQSGNPTSPNYLDQFLPWLNGTTFPLPLNPTQQTHTLTLLP